ncbi:MAG: hypothetical protein WBV46_20760 [Terriglobales bacterium]|jgi:hypothetical protein
MAAAPNYPMPDALTWTLTIGTNYIPSRQGIVVSQGDQITFENNSGVDVVIAFQTNGSGQPVYAPMNLTVTNGSSAGFTAPSYDCAANYYINQANTQPPVQMGGPFAIQVGAGPLFVTIGGSFANPTYNPATVAVPIGTSLPPGPGILQMNSTSSTFGITWANNSDPFTPNISSTGGQAHAVSSLSATTNYAYTAGPTFENNPAGGRVVIQN